MAFGGLDPSALVQSPDCYFGIGIAGDYNDGDFGVVIAYLSQRLHSVDIRNAHVGDDKVDGFCWSGSSLERPFSARKGVLPGVRNSAAGATEDRFVIYSQDVHRKAPDYGMQEY